MQRWLNPLLVLLSTASGAAALIYEIVWFQLLELAIGSTAVSVGLLLAAFMGGLALGSLMLPRMVSPRRSALRVYAAIEAGVALLGLAVWLLMPLVAGGVSGLLLRGGVAAALLVPPTMLMGATLPALARAVSGTREPARASASRLGFLYAANIVGAVTGCLFAGFYLLRVFDTAVATFVAVAINLALTGIALAAARQQQDGEPSEPERPAAIAAAEAGGGDVYLVLAMSGFCALAAEAIWTRQIGLLFGASVYTLSIIVAVFLAGLGLGSGIGALLARTVARPRAALGWCQLFAASGIAWAAYNLGALLPYWPINPSIASDIRFTFSLDLARATWTLLPATLAWGASFPLALAAAPPKHDAARLFGGMYAVNTLGAIAGALAASLALVSWIGSQRVGQMLIAVSVMAALLLLAPAGFRGGASAAKAALGLALAGVLIALVPPLPGILIAHGRYAATWVGKGDVIYSAEGANASVAVMRYPGGETTFHVAGKIQASNVPRDMRLQRMLGHLTTLTVANPRNVLVIGCGAGVTAGAVSIDPRVERVTIAEIEPLVPHAAATYFGEENFSVLNNPKVQVAIEDGRHYLLTSGERFDGITVDPLDPWARGAANLYTREFFESMKAHLNPGGSVTMYIQLFETTRDAVKSAVATFLEVFPNGTLWANTYESRGYDLVLLGQAEPARIDLDAIEHRIHEPAGNRVTQSLSAVGMRSAVDLFATYAGRKRDLARWLTGAEINRDRNLRMQYLAGLGLDRDDAAAIYAAMLVHRRFPEDIFVSREGRVEALREALLNGGRATEPPAPILR